MLTRQAAIGCLLLAACAREPSPRPTLPEAAATVGVARMRADGTLELDLRGPGGAEARSVVAPGDPAYAKTLEHLGGMRPGEAKPIPAWPDPWDAAKVESAARAHAAARGWREGECRIEILGTDADGNAVVTVTHAPGQAVSLRVEPKGYTVVRELPVP